ncbi:MAG: tyrosine-protein phosphatase [Alphaproteobacteria bacterium]|nr:tyrosine-protein phosphatase [Alphaproteobacteria bacterium]
MAMFTLRATTALALAITLMACAAPLRSANEPVAATPAAGIPAVAHQRILPLQGQKNLRDLGGYVTADGRSRVKWGEIYRSGALSSLTDDDYRALMPLGIASVVDLRSTDERRKEPTTWRAGAVDAYAKDYVSDGERSLFAALMAPGATPEMVKAAMAGFYRQMPEQFADQYAEIFHRLAGRDEALLFHCTAGKDRTGLAAALVLIVLGVPRETVRADYELTDRAVDFMAQFKAQPNPAPETDSYAFLRRLPPEMVMPLMRADPAYLDAALAQIEQQYGSVTAYVKKRLGVTDAEIAAMRARLLEPVA